MTALALAAARACGYAAHAAGRPCAPVLDLDLVAIGARAERCGVPLADVLAAWLDGWHGANLAAPAGVAS